MSKNYYTLNEQIDATYTPQIRSFVEKIKSGERKSFNLTEVACMNPSRLRDILTDKLGYEEGDDVSFNGWEWDFWFPYRKPGEPSLVMRGTGLTFELYLELLEE